MCLTIIKPLDMTTEQRADYRIISKGTIKFSEIEMDVPMTLTAVDSLTKKPADITILPIRRYEGGPLPTVAFRIIESKNFNFDLYSVENQPFPLKDGAIILAIASGHLVNKLDLNHYDNQGIKVGDDSDLGFIYVEEDSVHYIAAHQLQSVSFGEKLTDKGVTKGELENIFKAIEVASRM